MRREVIVRSLVLLDVVLIGRLTRQWFKWVYSSDYLVDHPVSSISFHPTFTVSFSPWTFANTFSMFSHSCRHTIVEECHKEVVHSAQWICDDVLKENKSSFPPLLIPYCHSTAGFLLQAFIQFLIWKGIESAITVTIKCPFQTPLFLIN